MNQFDDSLANKLHEDLDRGRDLAKQGNHAKALEVFKSVFDEGKAISYFVGVRLSYCLSEIAQLGKVYRPAFETLIEWRDEREKKMLSDNSDHLLIQEWDAINDYIADSGELRFYDLLKQKQGPNQELRDAVQDAIWVKLISKGRYEEFSAKWLAHKMNSVAQMAYMQFSPDSLLAKMASEITEEKDYQESITRIFLVHTGVAFECALALKKHSLAKKIQKLVLEYQKSARGYLTLIKHAKRCGATAHSQSLLTEARRSLPESEYAKLPTS